LPVRCGTEERQALEQLCRCITRSALSNERVQSNVAGKVVPKLKNSWHGGTMRLAMSPLDFV